MITGMEFYVGEVNHSDKTHVIFLHCLLLFIVSEIENVLPVTAVYSHGKLGAAGE